MCYVGKRIEYSRRRVRVGKFSSGAGKVSLRKCPLSQKEEEELAREQVATSCPSACMLPPSWLFLALHWTLCLELGLDEEAIIACLWWWVEGRIDRSTGIDNGVWSGTIEEWQQRPLFTGCPPLNRFWSSLLTGFLVCEDRCGRVIGEGRWRGGGNGGE